LKCTITEEQENKQKDERIIEINTIIELLSEAIYDML
jgi:hypothetical protein